MSRPSRAGRAPGAWRRAGPAAGPAIAAAVLACSGCALGPALTTEPGAYARPDSVSPPKGERFYRGIPWGTEAQFNPVSLVVNGGFDQLRTENANRRIQDIPWSSAATNVFHSLGNTEAALRRYGWSDWVRDELLPLSTKGGGGGQWVPNYLLHLFAGGMTGVRVTEWYARRGTPHPEVASFATVYAWHFLTEMVEHQTGDGHSVDAITDLLVFDVAAFFVWRADGVQRLFSTRVEMTNWPGQPSLTFPGPTLQNMHQTTMVRVDTPWADDWRPMTTLGGSFLLGLSRRAGGDHWLTVGAGWDPSENPVIDPETGKKTVVLNPNAGLFWDRDGSLLASLLVRANRRERVQVNLHPGVVAVGGFSPGLWAQWVRGGVFRFGVATPWGLGLGVRR